MNLSEFLTDEYIIIDTKGHTKFQIIEELMECIGKSDKVTDKELALNDIIDRERYLSTGLEHGLAVPHGKSKAVTELIMCFGISKEGVDFDSLDGKPAQLIFLLLSPKDTSGPHIQALAKITRKMKNEDIRKQLINADSIETVRAIFEELDAIN